MGNFAAIGMGRHMSFLGLDFLPDFVAVVSIGFLFRRKWLPVVLLNAGLLAVFFVNPLTSMFVTIPATNIAIPFAWMHIAAFVILLSPLARKAPEWIESAKQSVSLNSKNQTKFLSVGLLTFAFIGTMMQHLTGNILFEVVFGQIGNPPMIGLEAWPRQWQLVVLAYPVERTILIICAVLIGAPLIWTILKNNLIPIGRKPIQRKTEQKQT